MTLHPPSATRLAPVTQEGSADATTAAARAISSGRPNLLGAGAATLRVLGLRDPLPGGGEDGAGSTVSTRMSGPAPTAAASVLPASSSTSVTMTAAPWPQRFRARLR